MDLNIIKLDYNVVIANINQGSRNIKKILLVSSLYDKKGMVSAYDLQGDEFKVEPDLGGFNEKTGKGWLDYWMNNRRLECVYENLDIHKEMQKMHIKKNDYVSLKTLKKFELMLNLKNEVEEESL